MKTFAAIELPIRKSVKKGDALSLLSLFSVPDRFKRMEVLEDAEEDTPVKVTLEGLGEADLKLGADMEKGDQKTIMTLFWFAERSKPIEIQRDAAAGEPVTLKISLAES
jgi:hypothetical protein